MSSDYLPKSVLKFIVWAGNLLTVAINSFERWQAPDPVPYLKAVLEDLEEKHTITLNPNAGKVDIVEKNDAWKVAEKAFRTYIQGFVARNPNVTNADREAMSLPVRDSTPTIHVRPTAVPNVVAETTAFHYQHRVRAINAETGKTGKPAGVYGVRFVWQVGGERPESGATMLNSKFGRRPELIVIHEEMLRGRPAYYAACYENTKGEAGPWSSVIEAYIG